MILNKKLSLETEVEIHSMDQVAAKTGGYEFCTTIPTVSSHMWCGGDGKGGYGCFIMEEHDDANEYCYEYGP